MASNTKIVPIPAKSLGQITCRANALWVQTATLKWKDATGEHTCEFSGSGEARELRTSDGKTMYALAPAWSGFSIECTFTFHPDSGSSGASAPKVQEPTVSTRGPFTRIEIRTEDDTDNDNNDTWLTIDLLSGVSPESHDGSQIDPSDANFLVLKLMGNGLQIATGLIVSKNYTGHDFQPATEYWYLDAKQDFSTSDKTASFQIDTSTSATADRSPADAILIRPQTVLWHAVQSGPDVLDLQNGFGVSLSAEGTAENNPQLHLFWYHTAARNLSLSLQPTWVLKSMSTTDSWYVAE